MKKQVSHTCFGTLKKAQELCLVTSFLTTMEVCNFDNKKAVIGFYAH